MSPGVRVEGGALTDPFLAEPIPEEAALPHALEVRLREFRAGRFYAKRALAKLGLPSCTIPIGPDRAPVWPAGITGSIAHTREICVAAAGPDSLFRAIGFDIEDDQPLPKEIVARVATPAELGAREKDECPLGIDLPKLLFVAKEAFYKMWFPVTGIFLEFHDVAVEVDPDGGSVLASPVGGSGFDTMAGRFGRCDGMIFCYFDLPAD